jgi:methylated-DNA-protein-cysteine methyltransferase-like protein
MPKPKSKAFARIRAEVVRLTGLIPEGKFTTYGSIATHMNVTARHVAFVMRALTGGESAALPWHRVVGADGRISQTMPQSLARKQRARLQAEGMKVDAKGFIQDADDHYHFPGPRRSIRWSHDRSGKSGKSDP